jgi:3'-phosphoadenosine 5'-phosphosulfate (PAPS) 3'-phosphatase
MQGEQDAYVHVTLIKKWDICAPAAILAAVPGHEGRLSTLTGDEIDYGKAEEAKVGGVHCTEQWFNTYPVSEWNGVGRDPETSE